MLCKDIILDFLRMVRLVKLLGSGKSYSIIGYKNNPGIVPRVWSALIAHK